MVLASMKMATWFMNRRKPRNLQNFKLVPEGGSNVQRIICKPSVERWLKYGEWNRNRKTKGVFC